MSVLRNPILPGFHPDPSICRAGEDYYLVNSSFEYFPGVPIFHSRDLQHWRLIGHCLTRDSQLPLQGAHFSGGIYAPTIRFHNGRFYMVTTNEFEGRGFRHFLVQAEDPAGPWSEPVWLDQGGIDPSLFFDDDGTVYFTANGTGWAAVRGAYQSVLDVATGKQSEPRFLWAGTGGAYPEAPHLFKRGRWYYLTLAEGGTAEGHMVTIARATTPWGPFESCPHNPILTHRSLMNPVQATGHADLFEDHRGQWWAVFLGYRYVEHGFHNLGRETFLAPVSWTDEGWPVINRGERVVLESECPELPPPHPWPVAPVRDNFDRPALDLSWVHLRNPDRENYSLERQDGLLSMRCAEASLDDLASPTFVARRQQHHVFSAAALLFFEPAHDNEEAGLAVYHAPLFHAEVVLTLRSGRRVAVVRRRLGPLADESVAVPVPEGPVELRLEADATSYRLGFVEGSGFRELATLPPRFLSTQVTGGYNGTMLGLLATSRGRPSETWAAFDWWQYEGKS